MEEFATVTVIVVALATSRAGTFTVNTVQEPPAGQFPVVTELGIRTKLPNFTWVFIPRPVPVIVSVKLPLPAGTFVGEMARIFGCAADGGGGGGGMKEFPPQPANKIEKARIAPTITESLRMEYHPAP
jgi:hypothetical protein